MRKPRPAHAALCAVLLAGCSPSGGQRELESELPLHLEEHLGAAAIAVAETTFTPLQPIAPAPESWRAVASGRARLDRGADGALRLSLDEADKLPGEDGYLAAIYVDLPELRRDDWAEIRIEARTDAVLWLTPGFNLGSGGSAYLHEGDGTMMMRDGRVHTYRLRADWSRPDAGAWKDPWRQLVLEVWAPVPGTIELLAVELMPKDTLFAESAAGVRRILRGQELRQALYARAPSRIEYLVRVPASGRLDAGLSIVHASRPVDFRVRAGSGEDERTLLEQTVADTERWVPATADLREFAGRTVRLTLETTSSEPGAIGLWSAPTVSGRPPRRGGPPSVVFYVIDGGGADLMSVYGYNRRTTPNLERLAGQGVLFERAYSNSAWTKPSTASFMTSMHQRVLGGFMSLHDPIPDAAVTMAEHFHRGGYQTAVFTSNPWAGSASNLQRGTDVFRDHGAEHDSASSAELQAQFWRWRESFPGQPFWVHLQTTDVHEPHRPVAPFAGMFVDPERTARFHEWWGRTNMWEHDMARSLAVIKDPANTLSGLYNARLAALGADRRQFFDTQRGLYDETMAHQDHQIGQLVERLRQRGEWANTLLVIASDHGHPAGSFSRFGRELFDPAPADTEGALADSYRTRIPLLFVWPGRLPAGLRIAEPVSMIDVLPTLLDLAGLPAAENIQGQSLVPLLVGRPGWQPRPVILEQLQPVPTHDTFVGHIEIIDGRWGASLEIWPAELEGDDTVRPVGNQRAARPHRPGMPRLLLYDLWADPFARRNVNAEHPELVEKYTKLLEEHYAAHELLAGRLQAPTEVELTPEQLETLRDLGYIN